MSVRGRVLPSTRVDPDPRAGSRPSSARKGSARARWSSASAARAGVASWSAAAWGAIGVTVLFIALTCWWLTVDRSVPVFDAGDHLQEALELHTLLKAGDLLGAFNYETVYPPLGHLVGALAAFVGGVNVAAPIIGENLVFVSLLTLGCYQTGRLLFGPRAGMLAAVFVLGSPLLIVQFHVFMLDAPEAAIVAVSMWLLLASEDFKSTRVSALAGVAVGAGLLIKLQFPTFVVGLVLVALARGGWRNWRGFALFCVVALVIGIPWYIGHISEFSRVAQIAGEDPGAAVTNKPPVFSSASLLWYFWSILNSQLLAPLFALTVGGTAWLIAAIVRGRDRRGVRLEFLIGLFIAWLAVTMTQHHDIRYDMPLMPYLAVIGTGWIIYLRGVVRSLAIAVLLLAVAANTLGSTFGVGGNAILALTHPLPNTQAFPDRVAFYKNEGFLVAGPKHDGDVPGLISTLGHEGVRELTWNTLNTVVFEFSNEGLSSLAYISGMTVFGEAGELVGEPHAAALVYREKPFSGPAPCTRLSTGSGVWVARDNPATGKVTFYCPYPQPHYYGEALKLN
jgi:4-amino-4-deoxy-L-arabinose transferase-like glycosyltransferase